MRIGVKSLLAAAVLGLSGLAAPAGAQDAQLVSYEELLDRVARLEEEMDAAPTPDGEGKDGDAYDDVSYDDGGFYAVYENVIVAPYFSQNTAYTEVETGAAPTFTQTTRRREFDWDMEYSPRFEIGNVDCEGSGWRVRYWHFEHSVDRRDRITQTAGAAVPNTATVFPDEMGFGITTNAANPDINVTHSMNLSVLDMEFLRRDIDAEGGVTASFGLRYARIDHWIDAQTGLRGQNLRAQTSFKHDFEGIGPTIAAEYLKRFDCSYWGIFVNARGSLLYGDSNLRLRERGGAGLALATASRDVNDQDLVSVGEIQMGLDYRRPTCNCHEIFFRVSLEAQYWINGGSGSAQLNAFEALNAKDADMGFLGVTIATGLDW
jgi:hypothetical protein